MFDKNEEEVNYRLKSRKKKKFVIECKSKRNSFMWFWKDGRKWHKCRSYSTEKARQNALVNLSRKTSWYEFRIPED